MVEQMVGVGFDGEVQVGEGADKLGEEEAGLVEAGAEEVSVGELEVGELRAAIDAGDEPGF